MGLCFESNLLSTLGAVLSIGLLALVHSQYMIDKAKVLEDKVLYGFEYRDITMTTVEKCFLQCYEDCFCMAFQMCPNAQCQLLSSNQFQYPSALVTMKGCAYYDMLPDLQQMERMTASGCNQVSACQFHDQLCQNGGSYVPLTPTNCTTPRYKCQCSPGYTGHLCQHAIKSCSGYVNGSQIAGYYQVFDGNMKLYEVYCDFDSSLNKAWTLVSSYQFRHKNSFNKAYSNDWPVNENTPRWDEYRLSKFRMQSIQNDSSKFRVTCKYDTDGLNYTDYLEARKEQIDLLNFENNDQIYPTVCSFVDYINIRGDYCAFCTGFFFQVKDSYTFHTDSSSNGMLCEFQSTGAETCGLGGIGEDNFGLYSCVNPAHRCSSSANATTQLWFGADWF